MNFSPIASAGIPSQLRGLKGKASISLTLLFLFTFGASSTSLGQSNSRQIKKTFTEPIQESVAASAESGIISKVFVSEGDIVNVGDPLATLNNAVLERSLAIAKLRAESTARLEAAKSELEIKRSQLEAVKKLVDGGHTNPFEVDQKKSEFQQALAELRAAEDEIQLNQLEVNRIQAQLDDRIIKSPIAGVVTELHKELGESISANEPNFATVVRINELRVRFYLNASILRRLEVGQQAVVLVGEEQVQTRGTITFVSPVINPESGLGRLDVRLDNQNLAIQSGVVSLWREHGVAGTQIQEPPHRQLSPAVQTGHQRAFVGGSQ